MNQTQKLDLEYVTKLRKLEESINQQIMDFKKLCLTEKYCYKITVTPIDTYHKMYDKDRGGIVQLLLGIQRDY